jgi:hypothetical protein
MDRRTWMGLIGITILSITASIICFLLFGRIWAAWGLIGAFAFFGAVAFGISYVIDRRAERRGLY